MNKTVQKILALSHVEAVDKEEEGYFVYFKNGYCWQGDPHGSIHFVMEETATIALREAKRFRICTKDCCPPETAEEK